MDKEKSLFWVGDSKKNLKEFPEDVKDAMGYALQIAQWGAKHPDAKPLKGFKGSSVLEVVENYDGDTFRAVYTVKFIDAVYVLHVFHKKSKHGKKTPKQDIELIKSRLQYVEAQYRLRIQVNK
jgi:phage-related protein